MSPQVSSQVHPAECPTATSLSFYIVTSPSVTQSHPGAGRGSCKGNAGKTGRVFQRRGLATAPPSARIPRNLVCSPLLPLFCVQQKPVVSTSRGPRRRPPRASGEMLAPPAWEQRERAGSDWGLAPAPGQYCHRAPRARFPPVYVVEGPPPVLVMKLQLKCSVSIVSRSGRPRCWGNGLFLWFKLHSVRFAEHVLCLSHGSAALSERKVLSKDLAHFRKETNAAGETQLDREA